MKSKKIDFTVMEIFVLTSLFMCAPLRETIPFFKRFLTFCQTNFYPVQHAESILHKQGCSGAFPHSTGLSVHL